MKRTTKMALVMCIAAAAWGQPPRGANSPSSRNATSMVIAQDSMGMQVMVKEKYGSYVLDTCTVVMIHAGNFVLVHRTRPSSWYPVSFHSVAIVRKFSNQDADTAAAPAPPREEEPDVIARGSLSIGGIVQAIAFADELRRTEQ